MHVVSCVMNEGDELRVSRPSATFVENRTAGVPGWKQERAWASVCAADARWASGATGVQAARRSYR